MTEQLVITNNRIADILDRLTIAPAKPVQDTVEYPTQPMPPPQSVSGTRLDTLNEAELRVWQYLDAHPEAIALSVRKLGEATDTNKPTAAAILARYKPSNGND